MALTGKSARDCVEGFREHLAKLFGQTIPTHVPVLAYAQTNEKNGALRASIGFSDGGSPKIVSLTTNQGELHLWIAQSIRVERDDEANVFRLATVKYWYRLQSGADLDAQALIRWEYDRALAIGANAARHHIQSSAKIQTATATLDLNHLHVPTGWVTIESVIRFLIHDLDVKPPCGNDWPKVLQESENIFRKDFSTRHHAL